MIIHHVEAIVPLAGRQDVVQKVRVKRAVWLKVIQSKTPKDQFGLGIGCLDHGVECTKQVCIAGPVMSPVAPPSVHSVPHIGAIRFVIQLKVSHPG